MKLHLGCGPRYIEGFYHIDALEFPHINYQGSVKDLSQFANDSIELIYAAHLLEHFGRKEFLTVLREWYRVLKPGGILRIAVPDFEKVVKMYSKNYPLENLLGFLVGGQKDKYDYHKMVFDYQSISNHLLGIGFLKVYRWDHRCTEHAQIDDYSQAYIPHLDKKNGELMSLNVEAVK